MLEGKRVIVTGGSRGIGAAIAERLGVEGCKLALCARTASDLDAAALQVAARSGAAVAAIPCDLAEPNAAELMVEQALQTLGGIDVLVNNAAVAGPFAALEDCDMAAWIRAINVNLVGTVRCCRAVLPHMKRQRHGKIINFSGASVGWGRFTPRQTAYVSSKFAVYGFSEALASEVAEFNIQVNMVSPGAVDTQLRASLIDRTDAVPHTRLDADPTVQMVAFLASERSGPMTGKLLSAHFDNVEMLAREAMQANGSPINTVRKIDGRNYFAR
jgi:NAD(P)-dependent dehydrogenase (short-subunit alcohol dehydrogenase family)